MGLTNKSVGWHCQRKTQQACHAEDLIIALLGNPNTGKSTVFNALTGLNQHTGNWAGKTVETAYGVTMHHGQRLVLVDLPGTYSLATKTPEEELARDFLLHGQAHCTIVVVDATCLERNLHLVLQTIQLFPKTIVCLNLMDEAKRKGIQIDIPRLEELLGIPVVPCAARSGKGLSKLLETAYQVHLGTRTISPVPIPYTEPVSSEETTTEWLERNTASIVLRAEDIANLTVQAQQNLLRSRDRKIDRILTSRHWGIPVMLLLLALTLFLTIVGANVPSEWLSYLLFGMVPFFESILSFFHAPPWLHSLLIDGVWNVLASAIPVSCGTILLFLRSSKNLHQNRKYIFSHMILRYHQL